MKKKRKPSFKNSFAVTPCHFSHTARLIARESITGLDPPARMRKMAGGNSSVSAAKLIRTKLLRSACAPLSNFFKSSRLPFLRRIIVMKLKTKNGAKTPTPHPRKAAL